MILFPVRGLIKVGTDTAVPDEKFADFYKFVSI